MTPKNESAFSRNAIPESGDGDHEATKRGTDRAGHIKSSGIQRNPGGEVLVRNNLWRNGLPRRIVQHRAKTHQQRKQQEQRWSYFARDGENPKSRSGDYHPRLGEQQELTAIHDVSNRACW